MKKKSSQQKVITLPSFNTDKENLARWQTQKLSDGHYRRYYLHDMDEYCDHLKASLWVGQKKQDAAYNYPQFLVDYFDFLYPSPNAYRHVIKLFYKEFVQPLIGKFLVYPTKEEMTAELDQLANNIRLPYYRYNDEFTAVSDEYVKRTLHLINDRKEKLIGKLQEDLEREEENQDEISDDVKKYTPLSFLDAYVHFFYINAYRKLWEDKIRPTMTFDEFLLPIIKEKKKETIRAVTAYLSKNRHKPKDVIKEMDALYRLGLKKAIPAEHLNIFWNVLQHIIKKHPHVKHFPTAIAEYKPFFTNEFLEKVLSPYFTYENQPFLGGITISQLRQIMYGNFTEKLEFKVGWDSVPFYYFLANCIAKDASFTGKQLEETCTITMADGSQFRDRNFRRGLSGVGIKLKDVRKGKINLPLSRKNTLQYKLIQDLFTTR